VQQLLEIALHFKLLCKTASCFSFVVAGNLEIENVAISYINQASMMVAPCTWSCYARVTLFYYLCIFSFSYFCSLVSFFLLFCKYGNMRERQCVDLHFLLCIFLSEHMKQSKINWKYSIVDVVQLRTEGTGWVLLFHRKYKIANSIMFM
jgi:hypothetical protein